jgi:hypothetical protein
VYKQAQLAIEDIQKRVQQEFGVSIYCQFGSYILVGGFFVSKREFC